MKRRFRLISIVVLLSVAILVVAAGVIIFGTADETVSAYGVTGIGGAEPVRAQVDGVVEKILVGDGESVLAGDTLARINSDESSVAVDKAQIQVQRARFDLAQLKEEYENLVSSESFETQSAFASLYQAQQRAEIAKIKSQRAESLYVRDLISLEEKDDSQLEFQLAQSYYLSLKDRADLLEKRYLLQIEKQEREVELAGIELSHAEEFLKRSMVVSPMTGEIVNLEKDSLIGRRVFTGETLMHVADHSKVVFTAEVSENDIPLIKPGLDVRVFINAYPHRTYRVFKGIVENVSTRPKASAVGIVFETRVHIVDPWIDMETKTVLLRPGLSGEAEIVVRRDVRLIETLFDIEI
jgi:multidrug resistance efflux pump